MVFDSGFKSLKVCQPSSGCRGAYFGSIRDIGFRDLKLAFILRRGSAVEVYLGLWV